LVKNKIFKLKNLKSWKLFESNFEYIDKEYASEFQDIFLEIEDYYNLYCSKSYFDNEIEEWIEIDDFIEIKNAVSLCFYVSQIKEARKDWKPIEKDELLNIIESTKRAVYNSRSNFDFTITYREIDKYNNGTNDKEIDIDNIDKLLNKEVISISVTNYINY
jgi:hypothetical protein